MKPATTALLLPAAAIISCTVGPEYSGPPQVDIPASFTQAGEIVDTRAAADDRWWRTLKNRELDTLVQDARAGNLDLALATTRIDEARALRRQAAAALAPRLGGSFSLSRNELGGLLGEQLLGATGDALAVDSRLDIYQAGFEAGWEIDIFGAKRRAVRGAEARADAASAAADGMRLAVTAEIADAYFALASLHEQKTLIQQQADSQKQQVDDLRLRLQAGAASQLDLDRAVGRLHSTRADVPALDAGIRAQIQRIALLLGSHATELGDKRSAELRRARLPESLPLVQSGIPASLLLRRPDLRQSERQVAAAAEDVGVAIANFYPSFRIGGGPTAVATSFGDLFDASRFIWQYGPSIEWNPFTGGADRAALAAASARQQASLLGYKKRVLSAISEVETRLASLRAETLQLALLQKAQSALNDAVEQVRKGHRAGAHTFLEVLVEEERLRDIQIAVVRSKSRLISNWILLHKSLGGSPPTP